MRRWIFSSLGLFACAPPPPAGPIELVPAMYLTNKALDEVQDGDAISLEFPPQGGHVLFVGAIAKNLGDPLVELRARLRSVQDNSIFGEEMRTVAFEASAEDATVMIPDLRSHSNVCNVPVCPSYSEVDLHDQSFVLEVTMTELKWGRTATIRRTVVPTCQQADEKARQMCQCECAANYVLGKCNGM